MGLGPCFLALILNGVSDAPSSQCCGLMVSGSKPCSSKGGHSHAAAPSFVSRRLLTPLAASSWELQIPFGREPSATCLVVKQKAVERGPQGGEGKISALQPPGRAEKHLRLDENPINNHSAKPS